MQFPKYILSDFCLFVGRRSPKLIKTDVKIFVNICMYLVVFITNLLWRTFFFQC